STTCSCPTTRRARRRSRKSCRKSWPAPPRCRPTVAIPRNTGHFARRSGGLTNSKYSRTPETGTRVMSQGEIVQCIGAVVDIQFPRDQMPKIYEALKLEPSQGKSLAEEGLTFEVQQQLG